VTDRSVVTRFEAKVDGYLAGVTKMQGATNEFAKGAAASATQHKADWDKVGKAALISGAVIGTVVVGAAKAYMDFEKAMSGVAAVADANTSQLKQLSTAARDAGKATVFSASDAARAEAELAKAGVSVSDILGGALTGSLNLAAAGQIDLAKSAEISAQAMNIFNLRGKDVGHIADVLTAGANKSAAGVDDLGMALQQGGLVAKQTGLTLEDTVGVLSAFADNALKSSDAGTSLRTMLQRLNPQSQQAADLMDQLGLRAYDAQGKFVGITAYAGKLQGALKGMTAEQRNATLQTLFGSDAVRGANILYEQGTAGIQKYISAVNDQGAAQRMAARQTDNLAGDIEKLKGALSDAFIGAGQGQNGAIRGLVQDVTNLVNKFADLPPALQSNIVRFAAFSAGGLLLAGGLIKVATTAGQAVATLNRLTTAYKESAFASTTYGQRLSSVATVATKASIALAAIAAAGQVAQAFQDQAAGANEATKSLGAYIARGKDAAGMTDIMREGFGSLDQQVSVLSVEGFGKFGQSLDNAASGFGLFGKSLTATSQDFFKEVDAGLTGLASTGHGDQAAKIFDQIGEAAKRQGVSIAKVKDSLPEYQAALDMSAVSAKNVTASIDPATGATKDLWKSEKDLADAADEAAKAHDELIKAVEGFGQTALDARGAARDYQAALDDATKSAQGQRAHPVHEYREGPRQPGGARGDPHHGAQEHHRQCRAWRVLEVARPSGRRCPGAVRHLRPADGPVQGSGGPSPTSWA
jgi:TP901 family phage tail tape measure protein